MKQVLKLLGLCLFVLVGSGSGLAQEKIVVAGSGDSEALLRILAQAFEKVNPGTKIEVPDSIGTAGGIRAAAAGRCDLGRTARPLTEKEKPYNLNYAVFAYSPVVFAVNPHVHGVDNLTTEQIIGIFSGRIVSWSELGGRQEKIYVAQREEGEVSRAILENNIPGWKDIRTFTGEIIYSSTEMPVVIKKYRGTIGYAALSMAHTAGLTVLKVNGIYPTTENVKNGKYGLIAPFGLVWKGELNGVSKIFVDFIFSAEGQRIIAENGAVPVK